MARSIPHSISAEEHCIGCILVDSRCLAEVAADLVPEDYYHPHARLIYEEMLAADAAGSLPDALLLVERLGDRMNMAADGGVANYLYRLKRQIATTAALGNSVKLVADLATMRRVIDAGTQIVMKGRDKPPIDEYLDEAQRLIFNASRAKKQRAEELAAVLPAVLLSIGERSKLGGAPTGITTGHGAIDDATSGLQPGELALLAARPSMGKTALAMGWAVNAALAGVAAMFFSLEMSKAALTERLLSSEGRIDSYHIRRGVTGTDPLRRLHQAASRLANLPIVIDDSDTLTLTELRARSRRWRGEHAGKGLIVVDYLQLLKGAPQRGKEYNREREIGEISRGLKALAKELSVPVLALAQLNRSVESRPDKRPRISDLRESGSLEQDADLICFIYRDEVYKKNTKDRGVAEIIIAKQRNGKTGTERLAFLAAFTRFENLAYRNPEQGQLV